MTSRKNHSRTILLTLGLVLAVCSLSFAGWRVGAHELGWRWLAQPASAVKAQPQVKRVERAADAWWAKLRGLGSFSLGTAAGTSGTNALATTYTFSGTGNWTDAARWSPSYPGLTIASGDAVSIASGAICTIPNFTTVTINGMLTVNGTLNKDTANAALTNSASGSISIPAGGAINNNSGAITNAGTLTAAASSNFTNGSGAFTNSGTFNNATTFHTQYGSFGNSGTVINTGTLTGSQYASISNTGSWTNSAGGSLTMNGLSNSAAGTITNNGTMSAGLINSGTVINNATFNGNYFGVTNNAGATWTNSTGSTMPIGLQPWTNSGTWHQQGSFSMTEGSGLSSINNTATGVLNIGGSFTLNSGVPGANNGTINVNSGGSLALNGSHATFTNNGTLANNGTVTNASVFKGTGSHTGNVFTNSSGGTVAPGASPGCHSFSDYTNAGTLAIEIGGATPCTQHDQLQASGTATLGGTLTISMFGGYTPGTTTSYTILTAATVSGTFATINYPTVCGIAWSIAYNATSVVATATVAAQPEINVQGNGVSIADGDPTPSAADHTDFGSVNVSSGTIQRTFTIQNTGAAALSVSGITKSGTHQADFTIGALTPASPIPASGSATFTVTFDPSAAGTRSATINIANSDCDEAAYDFAIQGTGANTAPTVASDAGSKLFIGRPNGASSSVARVNTDGTGLALNAIPSTVSIYGVAVDSVHGKIYYTAHTADRLKRANLDGTGVEENFIVLPTGSGVLDVVLDVLNGYVYWTLAYGGSAGIWRANLDGTGSTQILARTEIYAIALNVAGNKIYYGRYLSNNIGSCTLTGGSDNPNWLVTGTTVTGLAVDLTNGKLYWNRSNGIGQANLDGSGIVNPFITLTNAVLGIVADSVTSKLFWARSGGAVGCANLNGTGVNESLVTGLTNVWFIGLGSADFEGTQATRTGTYSDPDGNTVTISANIGSVTKTGTSSGTWTWTYMPPDGPVTHNVTITANDGSTTSATSFTVIVLNITPTATFAASSTTVNENTGAPPSVSFTNPVDPGTVDVSTGLKYSYDFNNDGTWDTGDGTYAGSVSAASQTIPASYFAAPAPAQRIVKGRILDKDGGYSDYTATITINRTPSDIALSTSSIAENNAPNATVGTLSASDPDMGNTHAFTLVGGTGSSDNASFSITGNTLKLIPSADYETKNSYALRVRATDAGGLFFEKSLTVTITDVPENTAPAITRSNAAVSANEGATAANSGTFSDAQGNNTVTLSASVGTVTKDDALGTWSWTYPAPAGPAGPMNVTITATDNGSPALSSTATFTLTVNNVAPKLNSCGPPSFTLVNTSIPGWAAAPADFDGDGDQDIMMGYPGGGISPIPFRNNGNGTFTQLPTLPNSARVVLTPLVADYNSDGKLDFAVDQGSSYKLFFGDGALGFTSPGNVSSGGAEASGAVGDLNGDGKPDFVIGINRGNGDNNGQVTVRLNNGSGGFPTQTQYFIGPGEIFVTLADFNGDSKLDIAAADSEANTVTVLLNNGSGTFTPAAGGAVSVGTAPKQLTAGDFNNDGKQDLAVPNSGSANVSILLGNGAGGFAAAINFTAGTGAKFVLAADFNNDSVLDLGVALASGVALLSANGGGSFGTPTVYGTGFTPINITLADMNADGGQDIVVGFSDLVRFLQANVAPTTVTVNEGATATNSGTFCDSGADTVAISASIGTVTQNDGAGTWSWSYPTNDGPAQNTPVTITATDSDDATVTYTFNLVVANLNPTATLASGGAINEGSNGTVSFSNQADASAPDASAGFRYAYDFNNDGTFDSGDGTYYGSGTSATATVPASFLADGPGSRTIKGRIIDKDGGFSDYTTNITINNVAPLFEAGANETLPTTVGTFSRGPIVFTDPGADVWTGTVNYGDGTGNQSLTIDPMTKSFSLSHTYATSNTFTVTVTVNDDDSGSFTDSFTVTVNLNTPPTIAATANTRQQGSPATVSPIATVGDNEQSAGSLTVKVNGGATATVNGVTVSNLVNTNGTITASIVADCTASNASFTLSVTDNAGAMATAMLNVSVTANTPPLLTYSNQTVGAAGSLMVNPATGPSDNGSIASVAVLSVTPAMTTAPTVASNGVVTITNAGPSGSHTITIRVTDNCGATTDASFTLNVTCPTITIGPATISGGTVGQPYLPTSFTATGGNGSVTFSLSGTLPTGMTFANGQLADTPTQSGSFPLTITATDAYGCSVSKSYTLVISCPTIIISPSSLPMGLINTAYPTQTFTASSGNAPYTFTLSGALPAGMSFNGTQLLGTPTQHGVFSLALDVTDKYGCTASRSYTLTINRPPEANCKNVTVASGTNNTASASIDDGSSDPDGDSITRAQSPAGPYPLGTTTVTLTVTDSKGATSKCTATVTVVRSLLKDYVVFGQEFARLRANTEVYSGNVGVNTSLPDPNGHEDDKEEVEIGERVKLLQVGSFVIGDTVRIRANAQVQHVAYNELISPHGDILGSEFTPLVLPMLTLPVLPTSTPGTQNVEVPKDQTMTLAPGTYRNILVNHKGTLVLTGGVYHFNSLDIRQDAKLLCNGPTEIRVKNEVDTDTKAYLGPAPSASSLTALDIILYVEGTDDKGRPHPGDEELAQTVVQFGQRNTLLANIYAPNGTILLRANTVATGAFVGKQVHIGQRVELRLKSAFSF